MSMAIMFTFSLFRRLNTLSYLGIFAALTMMASAILLLICKQSLYARIFHYSDGSCTVGGVQSGPVYVLLFAKVSQLIRSTVVGQMVTAEPVRVWPFRPLVVSNLVHSHSLANSWLRLCVERDPQHCLQLHRTSKLALRRQGTRLS